MPDPDFVISEIKEEIKQAKKAEDNKKIRQLLDDIKNMIDYLHEKTNELEEIEEELEEVLGL